MKKLLALLAVVLCVVSCQTEPEGLDVNVGGEIDAIVNVTIPEAETRATNSAEGAFKNVDFNEYTIRYILQVYYNNEPSQERLVKYSDSKSVAFDVRLVPGRDYNFVVWADIVEDKDYQENEWSNNDGLHYNTTDLQNISLKQTWVAMDETRDAFTATVAVNGYSSASNITVNLKRPFAKLRVVTTDMVALNNLGIAPYKATVSYANKHRESFNALNGTYGEKTKEYVSFTYNIAAYGDNSETDKVLFTDYFFAPERDLVNEPDLVKFNLTVMEANGSPIGETVAFNTDIPVNANYLTTIKGNILTDGKNFNVTIDDAFAGENKWPNTPAGELAYAAMFGGEVTLTEDVVLAEPLNVTSELTINLVNYTISGPGKNAEGNKVHSIVNNGKLVINGGTVESIEVNGGSAIYNYGTLELNDTTINGAASDTATGTASYAVNNAGVGSKLVVNNSTINGRGVIGATNGTKVEINGGIYHTPAVAWGHAIYADGEGTEVVVKGGTFSEGYAYNASNWGMYQIYSGNKAKVTVYGGDFSQPWDCANGYDLCTGSEGTIEIYGGTFAENPSNQNGKNFVAAGYKVIENAGKFNVVPVDVDNVVADKAELKTVLEAVAADTTNVVIDANGANIGDLNYGLTKKMVPAGRTVTIRNANVEGTSYGNGVNGTVIFEGCTFNNSGAYSIHFDNGNGNVIFKNCKLYGWNSFGSSLNSVSFENCTLDGNGTYALIRSYVALTLTNCVINTSNANHSDAYSEGVEAVAPATLTENNVTYVADNADALADALANGGSAVMTDDIETEAATTAPYGNNKYAYKMDGGTLDGNGHELYMECYGDDYGIMTSGGTIKNLTIEEGCRAVMIMYPTQDVILDNVNIGGDGVLYPINTGEAGAEGVNLVVTNSTLAGWTSFSNIESASFTNVEFKQGTYYNNIYGRVLKPYVNTTLTNCSFIEHMNLDLSSLINGQKVTFKNCTVNGQVITASTFTVPSTDAEYDTELFTIDLPSWASSVNDCVIFE